MFSKGRVPRCFVARTASVNRLNGSGNQHEHLPKNASKKESSWRFLRWTGVWASSSPCLKKDSHTTKYSENIFDMQFFSGASQPERRLISLPGHDPRREFSVLSTLETQKTYLWDLGSRTAVKSVNAALMQGDESYSNSVWYLCCCPTSRMEWSPYNSNCSSASVFSCQCRAPEIFSQMQRQKHTSPAAWRGIHCQMQAFCRESKRNKADISHSAGQFSLCKHPFGAVIPSRGRGEKTDTQQCANPHRQNSFNAA